MNLAQLVNLALLVVIAMTAGCERPLPTLQYLADRELPIPAAHLPVEYRLKNWIGVNDRGAKGGSCFWASLYMCIRHADRPDIEELLLEHRDKGFEGPEHLLSMCRKLESIGIPWAATEDGDVELLQRASDERRWAAIGYYPGHAICFCGFYYHPQAGELAILLDNNFPEDYIGVPRPLFIDSWQRAYGGMAIVPWLEPAVIISYPRTLRIANHAKLDTLARTSGVASLVPISHQLRQRANDLLNRTCRLGCGSRWASVVASGPGCLRARYWLGARPDHWPSLATYHPCLATGDFAVSAKLQPQSDRANASAELQAQSDCANTHLPKLFITDPLASESLLPALRRRSLRQLT